MLLKLPRGASRTVETPVGQIDFMPTILDYLGIEIPADAEGRAWDLDAPERIKERPIFSETFNPQSRRVEQLAPIALRSVISSGHKLILDQINNTLQIPPFIDFVVACYFMDKKVKIKLTGYNSVKFLTDTFQALVFYLYRV